MLSLGLFTYLLLLPLISIDPGLRIKKGSRVHILRINSYLLDRMTSLVLLYTFLLTLISLYGVEGVQIYSGLLSTGTFPMAIELLLECVILFAWSGTTGGKYLEQSPLILLLSIGAILLLGVANMLTFYLALELQSFSLYIKTVLDRKDSEESTYSGLKYFLLGALSSCIILLGLVITYSETGSFSLESLYYLGGISPLALGLILVGLGFKVTAAPFHFWGPDVYNGVPVYTTMWLILVPKISLLFFIINLASLVDLSGYLILSSYLSLILGAIIGLGQEKVKRLLAYSTISHIGFLLIALSISTPKGIIAFLFYLGQYSLVNLTIFLGLYTVSNIDNIKGLRGLTKLNPILGFSLSITLFSIAGTPPLVGFYAKYLVLDIAVPIGHYFLVLVAILTSVISGFYYLRIIRVITFLDIPEIEINIKALISYLISILTLAQIGFLAYSDILFNSLLYLASFYYI